MQNRMWSLDSGGHILQWKGQCHRRLGEVLGRGFRRCFACPFQRFVLLAPILLRSSSCTCVLAPVWPSLASARPPPSPPPDLLKKQSSVRKKAFGCNLQEASKELKSNLFGNHLKNLDPDLQAGWRVTLCPPPFCNCSLLVVNSTF